MTPGPEGNEASDWMERARKITSHWYNRLDSSDALLIDNLVARAEMAGRMAETISLVKRYFTNSQWVYGMDHGYFCRECKNSPKSGHTKECAVGFIFNLIMEDSAAWDQLPKGER